ncbi:MAG: type II toxin-antitoxin system Phd/YefM family antitoxin [bacterium]|nr:type II toxin-antitoxin system Phd/YefM family antitoxin [bacterium]
MVKEMNVAEAKQCFSELMARVGYSGDEYIIKQRGKPMVAIVRPEYIQLIQNLNKKQQSKGLIDIAGKFDDSQDFVLTIRLIKITFVNLVLFRYHT